MDYRIEWSPEAAEDVDGIADFIGRDSAFYARAVVAKILAEARSIPEFPLRGRVVPELGDEAFARSLSTAIAWYTASRAHRFSLWRLIMGTA